MVVEPQVTELIGEYRTNIDGKGRVGLGGFRQHFEDTVVAVKLDGYLAVMSPAQFRIVSQGIRQQTAIDKPEHVGRLFDVEVQRFKRHFYSNAFEVSLDAQGRMTVPAKMREELTLVKDVVWAGSGDMLELWQAKQYDGKETLWREEGGPERMVHVVTGQTPAAAMPPVGSADDGAPSEE